MRNGFERQRILIRIGDLNDRFSIRVVGHSGDTNKHGLSVNDGSAPNSTVVLLIPNSRLCDVSSTVDMYHELVVFLFCD